MTRRERREARLGKRLEWAGKAEAASAQRFKAARKIADGIPMGQPILVGHHSEGHARADQARIHSNMEKGCERADMARKHSGAADALEREIDRSIYSDDANAIEALEARIASLEKQRERMRTVNRLYRKGDAEALAAMGLDLETLRAKVAAVGYSWVTAPFEKYQLANLGTRIAADRKRIESVRRQKERTAAADAAGGVALETSSDGEYCSVTFAEKPERAILDALKAAGFHWGGGSWSGRTAALPAEVRALIP